MSGVCVCICMHHDVCTYLCGLHGWLSIRSRVFDLIHHAGVQSHQRRHQVQVRGGQEETALMRDEVCVDIYTYIGQLEQTAPTDPIPPHTHKDGSTHTRPIPRHGCTSQLNKSMMSFLFSSSMVSGRVLMYELSSGFHPSCPVAQHSTAHQSTAREE